MSLNLASLLTAAAARHPRRPAVVLGDAVIDFVTLEALSRRFAGALRGLGVARGQHVALLLPNVPWFSVAYWGAHMAGNPVVPLNVLLTGPEVAYHLQDSDSVVIIAWEGMAAAALAAVEKVPTCRVVVVTADRAAAPPDGALAFFALMAAADPIDDLAATMPDDPAVLLYTSGTTGAAKGAQLSHFNMYYNAEYSGTRLLPLGPDTVALVTLPLFHSFGQTVMHNAVLARGGCLVLLPRFEPLAALTLMAKHRVTFFGGVPTMYFALLHHPDAGQFDLSSLSLCVSGGAAMPVEVMRAFDERYGVNILEGSHRFGPLPHEDGVLWGKRLPRERLKERCIERHIEMLPGDVLIFGPNLVHYSHANTSDRVRCSIDSRWFGSDTATTRQYYDLDAKRVVRMF